MLPFSRVRESGCGYMKPASEPSSREDIHWWKVEWDVKLPSGSGISVETVVPAMAQSS